VTQKHIETGLVPGGDAGRAPGKIAWYKTMGFRDRAAKDPMRTIRFFEFIP